MRDVALVVVDMLYDFIDGTMACQGAGEAVRNSLKFIEMITEGSPESDEIIYGTFPILFVRDSHPQGHCSFQAQGGPWPEHCVQGTHGAEIHEALRPYATEELTFYKGYKKDLEQYSGFEGVNHAGQSLHEVLELLDIKNVYVCGIATEYCVQNTCEDLKKAGLRVLLLQDCLAWVDPQGHREALAAMQAEGIKLISQ